MFPRRYFPRRYFAQRFFADVPIVSTLAPTATDAAGDWVPVGAATIHAALADASDATIVHPSGLGNSPFAVGFGSITPGANLRFRIRARRVFPTPESYSTAFPLTENPIVEDGLWLLGAREGVDWSDFRTETNFAYGTQSAGSHGNGQPGGYNDSVALRLPRVGKVWTPNQDVRGRVKIVSRSGWTGFHECQLLLRGTMHANWLTVYEAIFSVVGGTTYYQLVRFNGPLALTNSDGGWTSLKNVSATGVEDGTYCRATAVGTVLTMYTSANGVDWTSVNSYDTTTGNDGQAGGTPDSVQYSYGLPGMMHWTNGSGNPNTYGWSQWSAQEFV